MRERAINNIQNIWLWILGIALTSYIICIFSDIIHYENIIDELLLTNTIKAVNSKE